MIFERLRSKPTGLVLRVGLAVAILIYGIYIADFRSPRILIFGLALYALPLVLQLLRSPLARAYALWFGVFLVAQGVMTPILLGDAANLYNHVPNLTRIVDADVAKFVGSIGSRRATTDELGFRVLPRVDYGQASDLRIFAIGGSTTEEFSLSDEETWTHRVQLALANEFSRHVEVINAGTSGAMTQHHLAMLRYLRAFHPDIAIFLVGANDWNFDIHQEFGSDIVREGLMFPETSLGRLVRTYYYRIFGATVAGPDFIPTGGSLRRARTVSWSPDKASDRYLANLAEIGDACRESNLACVFITQPSAYHPNAPEELKDRFWMSPPAASYSLTFESLVHVAEVYNRALMAFANENGFAVCDLAPRIEATVENFVDELHFSFKGSARVAGIVTECLRPLLAQNSSNSLR